MTVYWILIIVTLISHVFFVYYDITRRKYSNSLLANGNEFDYEAARAGVERKTITVFFVIYIILLCLRDYSVGVDLRSYVYNYFLAFRGMNWSQIVAYKGDELAFSFLTKIIGILTSNPQVFISIIAFISVVPLMVLYRREVKRAILCCSFLLISLVFEIFFSGLRQAVAIGLVIMAFYFAKNKKPVPFVLMILAATRFHLSAFIALLIYPIYHAKITRKWLWFVVPIMAFIYYFNSTIFNTLLLFSGEKYSTKYSVWGLGTTNQYGLLILFVLLSLYCFFMMDEDQADSDDIGFRNLLLLATLLQFFAPLHFIASRMNYYFIMFIPIALTRANDKCKGRYWQIAKVASVVMSIYFIYYFFFSKGDTLQIMDYKFFFSR